jgi:hypothetical protein
MSREYRIELSFNGCAWGRIDVDVPWAAEVLDDIRARFSEEHGYRMSIFVADAERRIIESGPEGIRLLSRAPLFKPLEPGDSI